MLSPRNNLLGQLTHHLETQDQMQRKGKDYLVWKGKEKKGLCLILLLFG